MPIFAPVDPTTRKIYPQYVPNAGGAVGSVAGRTGTIVLSLADVADTATKLSFLPAERTKLANVAANATQNDTNANLRDRTTHTGIMPWSALAGVMPTALLPPLAISDVFPVASQAEMLALTAQRGDIAIRSDLNSQAFILAADAPATLANWKGFAAGAGITTVQGKTGSSIVLVAADFPDLVAKLTAGQRVYTTNTDGTPSSLQWSTTPVAGAVPRWSATTGELFSVTPTSDGAVAIKSYVDSKLTTLPSQWYRVIWNTATSTWQYNGVTITSRPAGMRANLDGIDFLGKPGAVDFPAFGNSSDRWTQGGVA